MQLDGPAVFYSDCVVNYVSKLFVNHSSSEMGGMLHKQAWSLSYDAVEKARNVTEVLANHALLQHMAGGGESHLLKVTFGDETAGLTKYMLNLKNEKLTDKMERTGFYEYKIDDLSEDVAKMSVEIKDT